MTPAYQARRRREHRPEASSEGPRVTIPLDSDSPFTTQAAARIASGPWQEITYHAFKLCSIIVNGDEPYGMRFVRQHDTTLGQNSPQYFLALRFFALQFN
jgi:hypothetical protein